jgi:hypothetical protein
MTLSAEGPDAGDDGERATMTWNARSTGQRVRGVGHRAAGPH